MNRRFSVLVRILVLSIAISAAYLLFGRLKAPAQIPGVFAVASLGLGFFVPRGKPGSGQRLAFVILNFGAGLAMARLLISLRL